MIKNIIKFPQIDKMYTLFVLEKNLNFKKDKLYVYSQINSIRELFTVYSKKDDEKCQNIIKEMLNKIIKMFEEIEQYEIMETSIWILANYSNELKFRRFRFWI